VPGRIDPADIAGRGDSRAVNWTARAVDKKWARKKLAFMPTPRGSQLVVFMVAGILAGIVTAYVLTPREVKPTNALVASAPVSAPSNRVAVATAGRQKGVGFKFPDGSSLVWTAGVGGSVHFTNATAVMPMWRFLQSATWQESSDPHYFQSAYRRSVPLPPDGPMGQGVRMDLRPQPSVWDVPAMQSYLQGMRSRSVDTYDFRRPLPPIDFKEYKQ
jgi:hypothetical protein